MARRGAAPWRAARCAPGGGLDRGGERRAGRLRVLHAQERHHRAAPAAARRSGRARQGIGARLVAECVSFARRAGYCELVLWTNDVLVAARRIYEQAGFRLEEEERHRSFGHDLVGQTWRLPLT